jgi:hypothetical protein
MPRQLLSAGAQHEQRCAFVGAQRFEQFLFFGVEDQRPGGAEHEEGDEQQRELRYRHAPPGAGAP